MKLFLIIAMGFFIASGAQAQDFERATPDLEGIPSGEYGLDKAHASITWRVNHLGLSQYTARFTDFDIDLNFNAKDPLKSSFVATINPASVETDYPAPNLKDFDKALATEERWFNSEKFPKITYTSKKLTKGDLPNQAMVEGELDFLGIKKPLKVLITLNGALKDHPYLKRPAIGFSALTALRRSDWGMDALIPQVGDVVEVKVEAEFLKLKPGEEVK